MFSPDASHLACLLQPVKHEKGQRVMRSQERQVVITGQAIEGFDELLDGPSPDEVCAFTSPATLHYTAQRGNGIYFVDVDISAAAGSTK